MIPTLSFFLCNLSSFGLHTDIQYLNIQVKLVTVVIKKSPLRHSYKMFHGYVMISLLLNGCVSGSLVIQTDPSTATETTDMSQTSEDFVTTTSPTIHSSKAGDNETMGCIEYSGMSSYRIITSNDILTSGTSIYWTKSTSETVDLSQTTKFYGGLDTNPSLTVIDITCSDAGIYMCSSVNNTFVGQKVQLIIGT
ncbi:unnamed protein product [Mytilus edulis]|uniref:Ig-like domain-containing protein n=1 Tax=Mytilus edulis TaxID=6550 RepID=A0A8S3RT99_MYTED|nr:unnamed protein product [Mytilus edulis]